MKCGKREDFYMRKYHRKFKNFDKNFDISRSDKKIRPSETRKALILLDLL